MDFQHRVDAIYCLAMDRQARLDHLLSRHLLPRHLLSCQGEFCDHCQVPVVMSFFDHSFVQLFSELFHPPSSFLSLTFAQGPQP